MSSDQQQHNEHSVSNKHNVIVGEVISVKMDKTIVVRVVRLVKHQLYGKFVRRYSKMYAHDPLNSCNNGDVVSIAAMKPISKTKRWQLIAILKHSQQQRLEDNIAS
jgi:small subunit ribosomal protein S17